MSRFRISWRFAMVLLFLPALALIAHAQIAGSYNQRDVKRQINREDRDDIWVLDFKFKDPRLITVDIPGRGRKVVWYLWYQLTNNTGQPHTPILDFELVTHDKPGVYHDQIFPKAQEAIQRIEGGELKNSVTMAQPLLPSKPEAAPRVVTGVAMWDDVNPDSNRYSIFISGLSNGVWYVDDVGGKLGGQQSVRRKTLQLNFKRLGDRYNMDSREIRFVGPAEWLYRASTLNVPAIGTPKKETEAPKQAGKPSALRPSRFQLMESTPATQATTPKR